MQIGHKILRLDTVDSTNNYTANLIKEGEIVHGTVIMADEQTAGKGQLGAIWSSKEGENILLSIFLTPDNLAVDKQTVLTKMASIVIVEFLRKIGVSAKIKWPNDIYVGDKKIAGILIENSIVGSKVKDAIIGIGLNVNQLEFKNLNATSIKIEKSLSAVRLPGQGQVGEHNSIENILFMILFEFNRAWDYLQKGKFDKLNEKYHENLYLLNQESTFEDLRGIFKGSIEGVSEKGYLIINRSGKRKEYNLKELKFIRPLQNS